MNTAGGGDGSCSGTFAEELQVEDTPGKALEKAYRDFTETKSDVVVRTTHGRCVTGRYCCFPESELCLYPQELKAKT